MKFLFSINFRLLINGISLVIVGRRKMTQNIFHRKTTSFLISASATVNLTSRYKKFLCKASILEFLC